MALYIPLVIVAWLFVGYRYYKNKKKKEDD